MSTRGTRKAGTHRMDGAVAALTPLGFSKNLIRDSIRKLIKVYGDNDAGWYFVEEGYYKLVIEKMLEEQDGEQEEDEDIMETGRMLTCKQARLELEASSSNISNSTQKDLSIMDVDTMETGRILTRKQARLELAGSSNNHNSSKKGDLSVIVSPLYESSSVQLEAHYDMVPGTKHCDLNLSSLPKRKPCYGWISEDEE